MSNLVSFLKTDLAGSKSLDQMIGFIGAVFSAMVEGVFEVNCSSFRRTSVGRNKDVFVRLIRVADIFYCFINGCFNNLW